MEEYSRNEHYVYLLKWYPNHFYWTGVVGDGSQLLLVIQAPVFLSFFFDSRGDLFEVKEHQLASETLKASASSDLLFKLVSGNDSEFESWKKYIQFSECAISIHRFFDAKYNVGIVDFARCFKAVLSRPSEFTDDDIRVAKEEFDRWFREGTFELWLNAHINVWVTREGEIESS